MATVQSHEVTECVLTEVVIVLTITAIVHPASSVFHQEREEETNKCLNPFPSLFSVSRHLGQWKGVGEVGRCDPSAGFESKCRQA